MYKWFMGIDCGLTGAVVLMNSEFVFTDMFRMPTVEKGGTVNRKVDTVKLADMIGSVIMDCPPEYGPDGKVSNIVAGIENPGVIQTNGSVRLASIIDSFGVMKGVLSGIGIRYVEVPAQKLKRQYNLPGGRTNKKCSVELALEFNPELSSVIKTVTDDADVAEAALIARYAAKYIIGAENA